MTKETYTVKARREAWLMASGMILVPLVAALAVISQMLLLQ